MSDEACINLAMHLHKCLWSHNIDFQENCDKPYTNLQNSSSFLL